MSSTKRTINSLLNTEDDNDGAPPHKQPRLLHPNSIPYASSSTHTPSLSFQQPLPLLTFSYTPSRTLEFTNSALRYYVDPPRGADLNYGVGRWVRKAEGRGRVDGLLRAWEKIRRDMGGRDAGVGVVGWRGVLTKILTAPYEMRDTWELNVMSVDGTMYFEEHLSDEKLREKNDISPHHRLQSYYGYAFESWCTSSTSSATQFQTTTETQTPTPNGWGGDVDTNIQWCCVVKTKLGSTRMVLGGEVDCVRGRYSGRTDTFVELKTSLVIRNAHDEAKFERKLLKHYIQSYLLGVPEIIVGFRTPAGVLSTIQRFKTVEIPRAVRDKSSSRGGGGRGTRMGDVAWDAGVCLEWGDRFSEFLKEVVGPGLNLGEHAKEEKVKEDPDPTVWRVTFTPKQGVSVRVLNADEVEDVRGCGGASVGGESTGEQVPDEEKVDRVGFFPRWFWDEVHSTDAGAGESGGEREVVNEEPRREEGGLKRDVVTKDVVIPPGWQI